MKIQAILTLEDDTSAEELRAEGLTEEILREIYENALQQLLDDETAPGSRNSLCVTITDNTKEGAAE